MHVPFQWDGMSFTILQAFQYENTTMFANIGGNEMRGRQH
jgi:hypothetical protein